MEIFGLVVLVLFAVIGFAVASYLCFEFAMVHLRVFSANVAKKLEVRREDIKERGELEKKRREKMRKAKDTLANRKQDVKIATMQDKAREKHGAGE